MNIKPFVFESGQKTVLLGGIAIGVICLAIQFFTGDQYHTEFWSSLLQNSAYFVTIAFTSTFFLAANITGYAGWITPFRRIWEHLGGFLLWMLVPMAILVAGVWGHLNHLYHWNTPGISDPANAGFDKIIAGKSSFLNPVWYTVAGMGFVALWFFVAQKIKAASLATDSSSGMDIKGYKVVRKWSALFLPLAGFLSPVFYWLITMSIDPHWYSTMYAWYSMVSGWLGSISFTIMAIIFLKSRGYLAVVTREHLHDLGKFLFGISIFWTYLWFDQFMLIWYSNNGEETIYFRERMHHYPILYWGNLLLNFVTPFLILMRNDTKRKFGTLFLVAAVVFFGHWWDYFQMIKPGARFAAYEASIHDGGHHADASAVHVDEAHATGAHAVDAHGKDTHGTDAHAKDAHSTDAHGADAHASGEGHHGPKHFQMGYSIPGLTDVGILIGFFSLLSFFLLSKLPTASMIPMNDPFLEESMHHATGAHIDAEHEEAGHDSHHH